MTSACIFASIGAMNADAQLSMRRETEGTSEFDFHGVVESAKNICEAEGCDA